MKLIKLLPNGQRLKVTSAKCFKELQKKLRLQRESFKGCLLYIDSHTPITKCLGVPDWAEVEDFSLGRHSSSQEKIFSLLFD